MSLLFNTQAPASISSPRKQRFMRSITVGGDGPNQPDENGRLIPLSAVPCYPILSNIDDFGLVTKKRKTISGGLWDVGDSLFITAGRIAFGLALKALELQAGDVVLLPAYHCLSMVGPLLWFGLEPRFYRIHGDLTVDFADLEDKLDRHCRAVLAVHYFGFPQDGARLRAFCDRSGLFLIEDCAHAFFGTQEGQALGTFGDFAIGSLTKFFPIVDGGCLVSARRPIPPGPRQQQSLQAEMKAFVDPLRLAHYYGRLRTLAPLSFLGAVGCKTLSLLPTAKNWRDNPGRQRSGAKEATDLRWLEIAMSRRSLAIARACDPDHLIERRRANYQRICEGLAGLPGMTLLKPTLEPGTVPYMVPLRLDSLRQLFPRMEDAALPMQRFGQFLFEGVDETLCPVAADLSHHGVQLPCHQSLRDAEIDWMIGRVRALITEASSGARNA